MNKVLMFLILANTNLLFGLAITQITGNQAFVVGGTVGGTVALIQFFIALYLYRSDDEQHSTF